MDCFCLKRVDFTSKLEDIGGIVRVHWKNSFARPKTQNSWMFLWMFRELCNSFEVVKPSNVSFVCPYCYKIKRTNHKEKGTINIFCQRRAIDGDAIFEKKG